MLDDDVGRLSMLSPQLEETYLDGKKRRMLERFYAWDHDVRTSIFLEDDAVRLGFFQDVIMTTDGSYASIINRRAELERTLEDVEMFIPLNMRSFMRIASRIHPRTDLLERSIREYRKQREDIMGRLELYGALELSLGDRA